MTSQDNVNQVVRAIGKDMRAIQIRLASLETSQLSTQTAQQLVVEIEQELRGLQGFLLGLLYRG